MRQSDNSYARGLQEASSTAVDEGLRAYMVSVYNYMAGGIFLTGLVGYLTFSAAVVDRTNPSLGGLTAFGQLLFNSPFKWAVMLAPLGCVFLLSARVSKMKVGAAQVSFWLFAAMMGLSLSSIFLIYTGESITRVLFVTAAAFAALSVYGYTTKKDLSGWRTFLIMGVVGIVIASLVNLWLRSSAMQFALSVVGVLVFAGLTAHDTQRVKGIYYEVRDNTIATSKAAIMGALSLYLNFINMFIMLLSLFGRRN